METHYNDLKFTIGTLYVPVPELVTLVLSVTIALLIWAAMRYTDLGKALRAMAEDGPIAAAFGINQKGLSLILAGACAALAAVAGICLALTFTLTPSQIFAWVGVVFAAVMLGGLGSALGPLVAGVIIGVSEAVTMAVAAPSWAPIVSFSLLIVMLLFRPGKIRA
jgi:branched-chain amino acid transport system permease protein